MPGAVLTPRLASGSIHEGRLRITRKLDAVSVLWQSFKTDNAPADRHDGLGSWDRVGDAGKPAYFFLSHKSMTVIG